MSGGVAALPTERLPAEVRALRDGVEIYDINYRQWRGGGDTHVIDKSRVGAYGASGQFVWTRWPMQSAPAWVFEVTGVSQSQILHRTGTVLRWRGVLLRWRDYQGREAHEWVPY